MKNYICIDESGIHSSVGHSTISFAYIKYEDKESLDKKIIDIEKNIRINYFHSR